MGGALLILVVVIVIGAAALVTSPHPVKTPDADTRTETVTTDVEPGTFGSTMLAVVAALLVIGVIAALVVAALNQANIVPDGTAEYWRSVGAGLP